MLTLDQYFDLPGAKTPEQLAAEVGVSESSLSRIRRGIQNTTRDVMVKIIDATGRQVSADALLGLHADVLTVADDCVSATNPGEIIREGQGADSPGPFSVSPSTCSRTREPNARSSNLACSTGGIDA